MANNYGSAYTVSKVNGVTTYGRPVAGDPGCKPCPGPTGLGSGRILAQTSATATTVDDCACPENYYGLKSTSCTRCPDGSSGPGGNSEKTACRCLANYYGNATTGTCTICANDNGTIDPQTAADTTTVANQCACKEGYYGNGATCAACPGADATPPSSTCEKGGTGTAETARTTCRCLANFYGNATTGTCIACANGGTIGPQTAAGTTTAPKDCSCLKNFYGTVAGTTAASSCQACPGCSTSPGGGKTCTCPAGTYWKLTGINGSCTACTATRTGTSTSGPGQTDVKACLCASGYYGDAAATVAADKCQQCPFAGSISTPQTTAATPTKIEDCKCPKGYYGDAQGSNSEAKNGCKECPTNSTTSDVGSTTVSACQCQANYYGNAGVIGGKCTLCPNSGTVGAGSGTKVSDCMCPANTYGVNAMVGCKACYASYSSSAGASQCSCAAGLNAPTDTTQFACSACMPPPPAPPSPTFPPTFAPSGPSQPPTFAPSGPPSTPTPPTPPTAASSKSSSGSSTGAIVGSICGVLVLGGIGYYFYSQKQALAKQAAENAVTGLDAHNKI